MGWFIFGSDDGNIYALNASTGTKLWNFATNGVIFSSPAVANGVVYVGTEDTGSLDGGNLYALNAVTGAQLWSYNTGSIDLSSPAVVDGVVYATTYDGQTYAFGLVLKADLFLRIRPPPTTVH